LHLASTSECVQVLPGNDRLGVAKCEKDNERQHWKYSQDGLLESISHKTCLANGCTQEEVCLRHCDSGEDYLMWTYNWGTRHLTTSSAGCLDYNEGFKVRDCSKGAVAERFILALFPDLESEEEEEEESDEEEESEASKEEEEDDDDDEAGSEDNDEDPHGGRHSGSLDGADDDGKADGTQKTFSLIKAYLQGHAASGGTTMLWPNSPVWVKHAVHGRCLQYDGYGVSAQHCNPGQPRQQWVYFPRTKQIMTFWHNSCLELESPYKAHSGNVVLGVCDETNRRQRWFHTRTNHMAVKGFGLCLHAWPGPLLQGCGKKGKGMVWHFVHLRGWAEHGGVVPPEPRRSFSTEGIRLPPAKPPGASSCGPGKRAYGRCGAEDLHHIPGLPSEKWDQLRYELWKLTNPYKVVVHIGDERGLLFRYGHQHQDRKISIASEMKPISTTVAMRLVELGVLGLDDQANRWLDWWPNSTADSRSYITLRHCLAFTTGFYGVYGTDQNGGPGDFWPWHQDGGWFELACKETGPIQCAKEVLAKTPHLAPPGTMWTYTADHLRIAAAMMVAATGKLFGELLHEHVFSRTDPPMTSTRPYKFFKYWNPASNVASTARDMQRFMNSYFKGLLLSNESVQEMEADQQVDTKVRYFIGKATEGRPKGHGLFGLGWWRSHSTRTECGVYDWCIFGPSHYMSMTAIQRQWPQYLGKEKCDWEHSESCSFYFHFQNTDLLDAAAARAKFREVGHTIERHVREILIGGGTDRNRMVA